MTQPGEHVPPKTTGQPDYRESMRRDILGDITKLRRLSTRGLWSLALFLLISLIAWRNFPFLPPPEAFITHLGTPPSVQLISTLFLIYTFFAILLSLSRMIAGVAHNGSFSHVGYLSGFFFFYFITKALDDNYWAVFAAGITILGIESYRIRVYCQEAIVRNGERLDYLEKTGQLPPDE
jgi:hypothetical protein